MAKGFTDEDDALLAAVHQTAQIQFVGDIHPILNQQSVNRNALGAGLFGDQGGAQQSTGDLFDILEAACQLDTAGLTATTGVDLGLDHPERAAQRLGGLHRFLLGGNLGAAWDRHAELLE